MRGLQVGVVVLLALMVSGCPTGFGIDGRIDKAAHKDTKQQLGIEGCSEKRRQEACAPGRENSDACRKCGGP